MAFDFVFLTADFYRDHAHCSEIESKQNRPHVRILVQVNSLWFAIPFRSNIKHPHAFITDVQSGGGIDYSKAVVLRDIGRYVDTNRRPRIRQNEFNALRGKDNIIESGLLKYIRQYKKALEHPDIPRNRMLLMYSTLQYFPEVLA